MFRTAHIPMTSTEGGDFKLILEGVIPAGYPDARICVDNITSYQEPCSALEPKPVESVLAGSYTWAHYFGITFIVALACGLLIPLLFLVGIIVICRRRHAYRHHHHSIVNGGVGGSYGNSKLFSTNLWHYIGGKEVADDPFAEHTASIHRPAFATSKFADGSLMSRGDGTLDLPDVVIPSGRVVGGTLMRQTSHPAYANAAPYGYQTMMTGKPTMMAGTMGYSPSGQPLVPGMMTSQPNFAMDYNGQAMMPTLTHAQNVGNQQVMMQMQCAQPVSQVMVQNEAMQNNAVIQPANYFQSLSQPAAAPMSVGPMASGVSVASQSVVANSNPVIATATTVASTDSTAPSGPVGNHGNIAEDSGPFVLPDPPSDHQHERDQVAAALDALNAATEPARPQQPQHASTNASAHSTNSGEHPPPGYDEAVGMVTRPGKTAGYAGTNGAAPVLPPRRTNNAEPLSLAERYGLPVADI